MIGSTRSSDTEAIVQLSEHALSGRQVEHRNLLHSSYHFLPALYSLLYSFCAMKLIESLWLDSSLMMSSSIGWNNIISGRKRKNRTELCSILLRLHFSLHTFPMNGTKWCSHRENISISLTITISSWSSLKMASFSRSVGGKGNRKRRI